MPAGIPNQPQDAALSLALAVVGSSTAPLLLLDGDLNVIAASASFCRGFDIDPANVTGRPVFEVGDGEWDVPQLRSLLNATVSGQAEVDAYELEIFSVRLGTRCLILNAQKLDYGDAEHPRLLLAVSDVTDARAGAKLKDDLLREKAILLQEVRHRVANSLQIIASVLLQSARRVPSREVREHLHDAHNRLMSFASLEQQLASASLGAVEVRPYFTQLCQSIGASMIRDHKQLTLAVEVDDSVTDSDVSVSLGLIVTELVINALKHAFPGRRKGRIMVSYHSHGPNWTLSVSDNGVGMPKDAADAKPGLGTSIVQALANQLDARIHVDVAAPGTVVSILHSQITAVDDDVETIPAVAV